MASSHHWHYLSVQHINQISESGVALQKEHHKIVAFKRWRHKESIFLRCSDWKGSILLSFGPTTLN